MKIFTFALLLTACGGWPYFPRVSAQGIDWQHAEAPSGWPQDLERILELQADAYGDPGWPAFFHTHVNVDLRLSDGPFDCSGVLAAGCTDCVGWLQGGNGKPFGLDPQAVADFQLTIIRKAFIENSALPWELGHVYLYTHGGDAGDSTYATKADFWAANTKATDIFAAENGGARKEPQ